ncbi:hypothetical protein [Acaryochloris marina]|uniref:Uncharacterized protein n=1 Tax=Acaryochloris marina (strain MBIC 11017) TaxID=329726 RepID=B0C8T4_ACAM1|nr:hypothetical protein [Acaryochloris marina]ABW25324.1 hypothetical protein AM1_0238 [Acaryochloris marina MBIC11017]
MIDAQKIYKDMEKSMKKAGMHPKTFRKMMRGAGVLTPSREDLRESYERKFSPRLSSHYSNRMVADALVSVSAGSNAESVARDPVRANVYHATAALTASPHFPYYFLDEDLLSDFLKTDLPTEIPNRFTLPKYGLVVLPRSSIVSKTGEMVCLVYSLVEPGTKELPSIVSTSSEGRAEYAFSRDRKDQDSWSLVWGGIETGKSVVGGLVTFREESGFLRVDKGIDLNPGSQSNDLGEVETALSVLLSTILWAEQNAPEYRTGKRKSSSTTGIARRGKRHTTYHPLMIGEGYRSASSHSTDGSDRSKSPHWRRGHWRRQHYGKGNTLTRWVFIAPTHVGLSN